MANTIKIKRSAVQGKVPVVGDLSLGELALNTYDGKLYTLKDSGTSSVVEIGGPAFTGYITENTGDGTFWNVVTQKDVGYAANQVPLNQYLGQLAFLDAYSPSGLRRTGGGSDDVVVSSGGFVGIGTTSPTSSLHVVGDVAFTTGTLTTNNLSVTGTGTFLSSGLKIRNPANTFGYTITGAAIAADRVLNLPLITGADTLAVLGLAQTFTAAQTFSAGVTATSTLTLSGSTAGTHVFGSNQITGTITLGGTGGTGSITLGRSTASQTTDIQAGVTASGSTKTLNIGTAGASGSTTNVNIGCATTGGTSNVLIAGVTKIRNNNNATGKDITLNANLSGSPEIDFESEGFITVNNGQVLNFQNTITKFYNNPVSVESRFAVTNPTDGSEVLTVTNEPLGTKRVGIGTTNPSSQLHITGQFQSTQANSTATGGGQIYLNGANGNRIDFVGGSGSGLGAPAFGTRSVGTKIVLYPEIGSSSSDYALGINNGVFWSSVSSSSSQFSWYAGETSIATLLGTGNLGIGITNPSTKLHVAGNITADSDIYVANTYEAIRIGKGPDPYGDNLVFGTSALSNYSGGGFPPSLGKNIAIGAYALYSDTSGEGNLAIGVSALVANNTGSDNIAIGNSALSSNTTGASNIAIGKQALTGGSGSYNTAIGEAALSGCSGTCNLAIGTEAMIFAGVVDNNIAIGWFAGRGINTASSNSNIFLGTQIGYSQTAGSNNVAIGYDVPSTTGSGQLAIGNYNGSWINGNSSYNVGIGTTNPGAKLEVNGTTRLGGTTSYGRRVDITADGIVTLAYGNDGNSSNLRLQNISDPGATTDHGNGILWQFGTNTTITPINAGRVSVLKEQQWTTTGSTQSAYFAIELASNATLGEKLRVTSSGSVGIGTTDPSSTLDVRSSTATIKAQETSNNYNVSLRAAIGGPRIDFGSSTLTTSFMEFGCYTNLNNLDTKSRDLKIFSASAPDAFILKNATGNVGIGTTNPAYKLEVNGDIKVGELGTLWFSNVANSIEKIVGTNSTIDIYADGEIRFFESDANLQKFTFLLNDGIALINGTTASGTANLQVTGGGYFSNSVGIGTASPASKLAVSGFITEDPGDGTYWNVVTQKDVGYSANQVPLNQYLGQLAFLDSYSPAGLRRTGGGSDDVVVSSTGLVGIGTTSPATTLDVVGSIKGAVTSGTVQASTAGTAINFTGIPSWVKRITVGFNAVKTSGTSPPLIQIGSSALGYTSTGYTGSNSVISNASAVTVNFTNGIGLGVNASNWSTSQVVSGTVTFVLVDSANNTWSASGIVGSSNATVTWWMAGAKSLATSNTLDRIRVTTSGGTETFAGGSINILYEG